MSSTRLQFSSQAQQDIDDIQQYTLEKWGTDQMNSYQAVLFAGFERLRAFPEIGRESDDGIREFALRHHVVLYRFENEIVTVLRVMHPRRLRR